eukprot:g1526.t1
MAYGQTSSGKTFTMSGNADCPGIIPLATMDIFSLISEEPNREFLLRVSMCEVYNEEVRDLLNPSGSKELVIREDKLRGVIVHGLAEEIVTSVDDVMALLEAGCAQRTSGSTQLNSESSRSHSIFRMVIESKPTSSDSSGSESKRNSSGSTSSLDSDEEDNNKRSDGPCVNVSCLTLVDLAGSERSKKTGATGARFREGNNINKSLMNLGLVIRKLSDERSSSLGRSGKGNSVYVPFRNSKLTRILQPSLGGNSRTAMLCMITPASSCAEDSEATLRFAKRCSQVKNTAKVNKVAVADAMIGQHEHAVSELRTALEKMEADGSAGVDTSHGSGGATATAAGATTLPHGMNAQPGSLAGVSAAMAAAAGAMGMNHVKQQQFAQREQEEISAVRAALQAKLKHLSMLILRASGSVNGHATSSPGALSPGSKRLRRQTWHPKQRRSARRLSIDASRVMSGRGGWSNNQCRMSISGTGGLITNPLEKGAGRVSLGGVRASLSIANSNRLSLLDHSGGQPVDFRARQVALLHEAVSALKQKLRLSEEARLQLEMDLGSSEAEVLDVNKQLDKLLGRGQSLQDISSEELAALEQSHLQALAAIARARIGNASALREKKLMLELEEARVHIAQLKEEKESHFKEVQRAGDEKEARRMSLEQLKEKHAAEIEAHRQRTLELEIKLHSARKTPAGSCPLQENNVEAKKCEKVFASNEEKNQTKIQKENVPQAAAIPGRVKDGNASTLLRRSLANKLAAADDNNNNSNVCNGADTIKTPARRVAMESQHKGSATASPLHLLFAQGVKLNSSK